MRLAYGHQRQRSTAWQGNAHHEKQIRVSIYGRSSTTIGQLLYGMPPCGTPYGTSRWHRGQPVQYRDFKHINGISTKRRVYQWLPMESANCPNVTHSQYSDRGTAKQRKIPIIGGKESYPGHRRIWKHAKALSQPQLSYSVFNTKMPFGITRHTAKQQNKTLLKKHTSLESRKGYLYHREMRVQGTKGNNPASAMNKEQRPVILIERHGSLNTKSGVIPARD